MRFLTALLVIANLVYFLWPNANQSQPQLSADQLQQMQGEVPKVLMLKEVPLAMLRRVGQNGDAPAEVPRVQPVAQTQAAQASPRPEPVEPPVADCYLFGPTEDPKERDGLMRLAKASPGAKVRVLKRESPGAVRYWVHIPPYQQEATAIRVSKQLSEKKVDNFRVQGGSDRNAISLGLFSSEETAKRIQAKVQKLGYKRVLIEERNRGGGDTQYRIHVQQPDDARAKPLWAELSKAYRGLKREACR